MKTFSDYIREAVDFRLGGKDRKGIQRYNHSPKGRDELKELMKKLIKERGDEADFNDIDTSNITDMTCAIAFISYCFNGDISLWDVSHVTNTSGVFKACPIREEFKPKSK